jgi:hypothetical protein
MHLDDKQYATGKALVELLRTRVKDVEFYMPSFTIVDMRVDEWVHAYGSEAYGEKEAAAIAAAAPKKCNTAHCVGGWLSVMVGRDVESEVSVAATLGIQPRDALHLCYSGYEMTREEKADQLDDMIESRRNGRVPEYDDEHDDDDDDDDE